MGDVGWGTIPYAEVVDDETEGDVAGAVSEQARGIGALVVAVAGQVLCSMRRICDRRPA